MTELPPSQTQPKRLYRDVQNGMVGGVAAGLAEYFNVDVTLMRVIAALAIIFTAGTGLIAYLVMWFLIPPKPTV